MRRMSLIYLRLELKRAWRRLPHLLAGAIMLLFLAGMVALLASRMLYGDQAGEEWLWECRFRETIDWQNR